MRILLVEDDVRIADDVRSGVAEEGHVVDWLASGRDALVQATVTAHDLLVVDRMPPDLDGLSPVRAQRPIDLQPREFKLLEHLMRAAGRVQTRTMLLEAVWDLHFDPQTNVVETHIGRLRAKVDKPFGVELIHIARGAGYTLRAP